MAPTPPRPAPPRVRFLLRAEADAYTLHDPHGKRLGAARLEGGALRPAWLRFVLHGRRTAWLEVRAGERWRRTAWVGRTKVFVHEFTADGERLGAVCVPQGPVRGGAAVLCVQDHRGEVVAEVRRRAAAYEVLCGGRPVARVTPQEDAYDVECGAMDPRMVLAVVPFLPPPS
jgi:hypothetical protein